MAMLPFWDLDESVKELRRCHEMGHRGMLWAATLDKHGLPDFADPHWDTLYALAQDLGMSVNFHVGVGNTAEEIDEAMNRDNYDPAFHTGRSAMTFVGNARTLGRLLTSGVCDRFPRLNFVCVESGFGYIPFVLESLDWQWMGTGAHQRYPDRLMPSDYFRRQVYSTFWFEKEALELLPKYQDSVMFETDFPHPTSLHPGPPGYAPAPAEVIRRDTEIVGEPVLRQGLHANASRVYHLACAPAAPGWLRPPASPHPAGAGTSPRRPAPGERRAGGAVTRRFLESGYTLIIGAGVTPPLDDLLALDAIDRGLIPGPRIVPSGAMIAETGGLGADGGLMEVAADAGELREIVARQCDTGVRALKLFISGDGVVPQYPSDDVYMNDEMLLAAVEAAGRHGAFITTHARGSASVAMAARTGVRIIHHACFLDDDALKALEARRDDVWVCPGLHYLHAMVSGHAEQWGITPEQIDASGYRDEFRAQVDGLRRLRASGIRIVAGGDFGHQWTHHGTYAAELQRYVELGGMTPVEAIHTATRNLGPAAGLDTGQVREGFLADLLVVDGDPTADVTVLQQPQLRRAVIKDGQFAYVNPEIYP